MTEQAAALVAWYCPTHGVLSIREVRHLDSTDRRPECMVNWFGGWQKCEHEPKPIDALAAPEQKSEAQR